MINDLMRGYLPLSQFPRAEVRTVGSRQELMLPGQTRPTQVADLVEVKGRRGYSKGIQRILELALEYFNECLRVGRAHNRPNQPNWDRWTDMAEGVPAPKGPGMICRVSHNVTHQVISGALKIEDSTVLSGPAFEYEPPSDDPSVIASEIAHGLEDIARKQIEDSDFDPQARLFRQAKAIYGYCPAVTEYEKRVEGRLRNGQYGEEIVDHGTTFQTILPDYFIYGRVNEPDIQKQSFVGYAHELTLPFMASNHIAAVLSDVMGDPREGGEPNPLVLPHGQFFNLYELYEKTKNNGARQAQVIRRDQDKQASSSQNYAIANLFAVTIWTQSLDMQKIVQEAMNHDRSLTYDEIAIELGIRPEDIYYCPRWKMTAVATDGCIGITSQPDVLVQLLPNPYPHGQYPMLLTQCMSFLQRTVGLGLGQICQYLQFAIDTLFTLLLDDVIKSSSGMYLVLRDAIANLDPAKGFEFEPNKMWELDPAKGGMDATKIFQRIGVDVNNYPQGTEMLDRMVAFMKDVAGGQTPPLGGRRTALEVSKIFLERTEGIQYEVGQNTLTCYFNFAKQQLANMRHFTTKEEAIRLAGKAGLKMKYVRDWQDALGGPLTTYPVQIRIAGRRRTGDKMATARMLTEMQRTALMNMWIQSAMTGQQMDEGQLRLLSDMLEWSGLEHPERYMGKKRKITTDEVLDLLANGEIVDVDLSRFRGIQEAAQELVAVGQLAKRGAPQAQLYAAELGEALQELLMAQGAIQQAMGPGQQGQGPNPAGMASQMAMPSLMAPGAMTTAMADVKGEVPNTPVAAEW